MNVLLNFLGPLVARVRHRVVLAGVVSFGIECAVSSFPGVYIRVATFLDWIFKNTDAKEWQCSRK